MGNQISKENISGRNQNTDKENISGRNQNTDKENIFGGNQNTDKENIFGGNQNTNKENISGGNQNTDKENISGGNQNTDIENISGGNQNTDIENLKLVLDGLRPAYLWYPIKGRMEPPISNLHKIKDIRKNGDKTYWYTLNKDFIIPKTDMGIGKALGYVFPHKLTDGIHFIIHFMKTKIHLWSEFIPVTANFDWNILAERLKELSPFDIFIKINIEHITFGNPY